MRLIHMIVVFMVITDLFIATFCFRFTSANVVNIIVSPDFMASSGIYLECAHVFIDTIYRIIDT